MLILKFDIMEKKLTNNNSEGDRHLSKKSQESGAGRKVLVLHIACC